MSIKNADMGTAITHKSSTKISSSPAPDNTHKKRKRVQEEDGSVSESDSDSDSDSESKEEVEKKIVELQKIVPGGESLDNVDNLFEETAGYILDLQNQIKGLRLLASFFELLDKQKSKLGG